jgi:hypothetical protein
MGDFEAENLAPSGGASIVHQDTGLTVTASGTTTDFSVRGHTTLWITAFIQTATGTTPSVSFYLEEQDANGHWIVTAQIGSALTTAPNYTAGFAGEAAGGLLAGRARVSWTVTGTTPHFTGVDISVIGR